MKEKNMFEAITKLDEASKILKEKREEMLATIIPQLLSPDQIPEENLKQLEKLKTVQTIIASLQDNRDLLADVMGGSTETLGDALASMARKEKEPPQAPTPLEFPVEEPQKKVSIKTFWKPLSNHILEQLKESETLSSHHIYEAIEESDIFPEGMFTSQEMRDAAKTRVRRLKEHGLIETVEGTRKILCLTEEGRLKMGVLTKKTMEGEVLIEKDNGFPKEEDPTLFVLQSPRT